MREDSVASKQRQELSFCDLHMHSAASDGTDPPQALPQLAQQAGLRAFALTDHDTTAGLVVCATAAKKLCIDFLPGIELSANPQIDANESPRGTLHILGYGIRHDHAQLAKIQQWLLEAREHRNPSIVKKLNELGVTIKYAEVVEMAAGEIVGRPHIAQVLLKKGYVKSVHEAFSRYIGEGKAAYARKDRLSAKEAIDAIHQAGGVAILAHPIQLHRSNNHDLKHFVSKLWALGLDGIETRHSDHTPRDTEHFQQLATRFNLLATGGSDYHGSRKSVAMGSCQVPYAAYEVAVHAIQKNRPHIT